ncbi:hypothetical protein U8607_23805 [Methylobacterium durans]|uniref:hypothetical protein n=1 Tax=Methylobacterium durans TaxID=2202825 RepID=UPI002AFE8F02|nr:hypothetical protein [Methylobacterium durans]MEA1835119.1 hypothetical protein [Methylobacterium durans]
MMQADISARPWEFWDAIAEHVTAKVQPLLRQEQCDRETVIAYLRDLEALARRENKSREAIQIIASGRRILGDRQGIGLQSWRCSLIAHIIKDPRKSRPCHNSLIVKAFIKTRSGTARRSVKIVLDPYAAGGRSCDFRYVGITP